MRAICSKSLRCWLPILIALVWIGLDAAPRLQAQETLPDGREPMPFQNGDRVLVLGDSITQDGRYVAMTEAYLWANYPDRDIEIFNAGLSSETVSGITEPVHPFPRPNVNDRVARALAITKPQWVLVCYGMNDGIYHPTSPKIRAFYEEGLKQLIKTIHDSGARTILLTPPVFDAKAPKIVESLANAAEDEPYGYRKPYEHYDMTLVALTNIVRAMERDPRVERIADVHFVTFAFLREAKEQDPDFVYGDGVHPPLEGHAAMALGLLFGLGEDEEEVKREVARIANLNQPGEAEQASTKREQAVALREDLFRRTRKINALLRQATNPKTPDAEVMKLGEQALAAAAESKQELKQRVQMALGSGVE